MKKYLVIILIALTSNYSLLSQETCKVLIPEIGDSYIGKCKKGLAHGQGEAKGVDTYVGKFRKGLPHGIGIYTWANGDVYDGTWLEGKMHGKGKLFKKDAEKDSVTLGIWEHGKFLRVTFDPPYEVIRATHVTNYTIRRIGDENKMVFLVKQAGSPTSEFFNTQQSGSSGRYYSMGQKFGYEGIIYPFTYQISFTIPNLTKSTTHDVHFEIEIYEPGKWEIIIND